jgi:GNAT superfamily N-acetyltransferase
MNDDVLLQNHLAFLRRHRGEIAETPSGYTIRSSRDEFTCGIALRDGAIEASLRVVQRPEFGTASAGRLEADGFRRVGAIRYMTRSTANGAPSAAPVGVEVAIASTGADADAFAEAQTCGFFDRKDDQDEWLPFMRDAARRNVGAPDQSFFVARVGGVVAGVTLTVETELVGVYAVATPAAFRRRGIATALLDASLRRAAERGVATSVLQVAVGSDAERLYSCRGFTSRFVSETWKRVS